MHAIAASPGKTIRRATKVSSRTASPIGPWYVAQPTKVGCDDNLIHGDGLAGVEAAAGVGVDPKRAVAGQGHDPDGSQ